MFINQISEYIKKEEKNIVKSQKITAEELKEFQSQLDSISDSYFNYKEKEDRYYSQFSSCYQKLAALRTDMICLRCSGDASKYFDATSKRFKVKKEVCFAVIKSCAGVFSFVAEANTFYRRLAQIRAAENAKLIFHRQVDGLNVKQLNTLKVCANDKEYCVGHDSLYKEVCKHYALGDYYPDLEGDVGSINDGVRSADLIADGQSPGKRRRVLLGGDIETRFAFLEVDVNGADLENEYSSTKKTGFNFKENEDSNTGMERIVNGSNEGRLFGVFVIVFFGGVAISII